jgi:endogenous inhibitor of DNA gyrase (YacG/DUF329 family)
MRCCVNSPSRLRLPDLQAADRVEREFPWRPFCSERCKLVDLGAWLTEAHAIPGEPIDEMAADPNRPSRLNPVTIATQSSGRPACLTTGRSTKLESTRATPGSLVSTLLCRRSKSLALRATTRST